jgi:hypothetical protein
MIAAGLVSPGRLAIDNSVSGRVDDLLPPWEIDRNLSVSIHDRRSATQRALRRPGTKWESAVD